MKLKILLTTVIAIVLGLAIAGLRHVDQLNDGIELKKIQLEDNSSRLKILNKEYEDLNKQLEDKDADTKKIEQERQKLEKEKRELEKALQAKKQQKARDIASRAETAARQAVQPSRAYASTGSCADWMAQAGVPNNYASNELIRRESNCNPRAVNSSSGACGIPQNINGCTTYDPVAQLRWMQNYVVSRYKTWEAAVAFHDRNNWY